MAIVILSGDPNSIPANMVERIEVLTDGASSVYGSDAVAGVVNFILRSDYQGAEFSTNYGISDKDDGESQGYQFTFGQTSDKGSIMAGISYNRTEQVLAGHRDFSKNSVSLYGTNGLSPYGQAYGQQFPKGSIGGSTSSPFGHVQTPDAFRDIYPCSFLARNPGTTGQNVATDYHCYRNNPTAAGPSDKYNFATVNLIMTPQERTGLFLNGNYKLTDNVEVYASVMHNKTSSAFQLAPDPLTTAGGLQISADSYYNPFGIDYRSGEGNFGTRLVTLGNRRGAFGTAIDQVSTGFKGSFGVWNDQQWNWDVGMDYGHVSQHDPDLWLAEPQQGQPGNGSLVPRFGRRRALRHAGCADHGCTPINIFDLNDPNTIAGLAAAGSPASSNFFTQEKVWRGDLNGGLFELPAGTMQLAVGASYRKEYTHSIVDTSLLINPATGQCVLGSQCGSALQGGYNVKDVYAELFIPILKDIPFIHALNLTMGDRYSKYNTFGNTNNSKIALEWRPIEDLLLRGTVSEVFRAPTVADIFASAASDAPRLSNDPCNHYTGNPAESGVRQRADRWHLRQQRRRFRPAEHRHCFRFGIRGLPARTGIRQVVRLGHRV